MTDRQTNWHLSDSIIVLFEELKNTSVKWNRTRISSVSVGYLPASPQKSSSIPKLRSVQVQSFKFRLGAHFKIFIR